MVTRYSLMDVDGPMGTEMMVSKEGRYVTHADYKALEEDRDSWRRVAEELERKYGESSREVMRLTDELAECRKDSERYRWLRKHGLISAKYDERKIDNAIARSQPE